MDEKFQIKTANIYLISPLISNTNTKLTLFYDVMVVLNSEINQEAFI